MECINFSCRVSCLQIHRRNEWREFGGFLSALHLDHILVRRPLRTLDPRRPVASTCTHCSAPLASRGAMSWWGSEEAHHLNHLPRPVPCNGQRFERDPVYWIEIKLIWALWSAIPFHAMPAKGAYLLPSLPPSLPRSLPRASSSSSSFWSPFLLPNGAPCRHSHATQSPRRALSPLSRPPAVVVGVQRWKEWRKEGLGASSACGPSRSICRWMDYICMHLPLTSFGPGQALTATAHLQPRRPGLAKRSDLNK